MDDERNQDTSVYDFSPDGNSPEWCGEASTCDGWSAYASWLVNLKAQYRRRARAALVEPGSAPKRSKYVGAKAGGQAQS